MARSRPRRRWVSVLALTGLALVGSAQGQIDFRGLRVEAAYTADDNVTRAPASDALADGILGVRVSTNLTLPVSGRTRAVFQVFGGGEKFHKHDGLSHNFIGGQGEFQFRSSAAFGAATYSAFLRSTAEYYNSTLRDGYRHVYGVTVLKPWTDRVQAFASIARNVGDGKSVVFDTRSTSLRGNLDWLLGRWDTVYLGAEYRSGDSVSTVCRDCDPIRTLGFINTAAPNIVQDDAFDDTIRDAYRLKTRTIIAAFGYNHAFGAGQSLDISWRRVQSTVQNAVAPASGSDLNYSVNQYSLAYLVRF
jgi:hypothetical protein